MKFVDVCAGIGGFRLGLEAIGGQPVYSCEIDKRCEATYFANFDAYFDAADIATVEPDALPDHDIFCAGFPCQPFSIAGKRKGFSDTRSILVCPKAANDCTSSGSSPKRLTAFHFRWSGR